MNSFAEIKQPSTQLKERLLLLETELFKSERELNLNRIEVQSLRNLVFQRGERLLPQTSHLLAELSETNNLLKQEIDKRVEVERKLIVVEDEYLELSQSLFEEANRLVSDEKKKYADLLEKYQQLEQRNLELIEALQKPGTELRVTGQNHQRTLSTISNMDNLSSDSVSTIEEEDSKMEETLNKTDPNYKEFKNLYKQINQMTLAQVWQTAFFKASIAEQVVTIIRQCTGSTNTEQRIFKSVIQSQLSIQPASPNPANCNLCKSTPVHFTFRSHDSDCNQPLCEACREKLVLACEIIGIFRMLSMGLLKSSPISTYKTLMQLLRK